MKKQGKAEWLYRVYDEIEAAFGKSLKPAQLAFLSCFSYYHFHRLFRRETGETVKHYINRLLAERAAYELKTSVTSVMDIAFAAGFTSNEAFTRSFRKFFGVSPSAYRARYQKRAWVSGLSAALCGIGDISHIRVPSFTMVYIRRVGSYASFPGPLAGTPEVIALERLAREPALAANKWVGICNDDPEITPADKIRFDLGLICNPSLKPPGGFGKRSLSGGYFVRARHRGAYASLPAAYDFLLGPCAAERGWKIRNAPPFEIYLRRSGPEPITDIYIPVKQ